MHFVRRMKFGCAAAVSVFRCSDYQGMNGSGDSGIVEMSDSYLVKHGRIIEA